MSIDTTPDQDETTTTDERLEAFMALSRVLLGADSLALELPAWLGTIYLETLVEGARRAAWDSSFTPRYTEHDIDSALRRFAELVDRSNLEAAVLEALITCDPDSGPAVVCRSIIALWYCAGLIDLDPHGRGYMTLAAPKAAYAEALVWKTMGANPMGVPGPYYGNWAYPATVSVRSPSRS